MNTILTGDCLSVMPTLPENSVDSVICAPPYGLDFMGKSWDHGVPGVEFWQAALRVAKPGAILLAFGGTRTVHRLACAIEDAGWMLRDSIGVPHRSGDWGDCPWMLAWIYGSGFPKSLDISKQLDKEAGAEREVVGKNPNQRPDANSDLYSINGGKSFDLTAPSTPAAHLWQGWGTALKPAWEPIIVAMKPLEGTYAENAQKWGVAGLNIDGGRIGTEVLPEMRAGQAKLGTFERHDMITPTHQGRWPANLLLDEEAARLLDEQSGISESKVLMRGLQTNGQHGGLAGDAPDLKEGTNTLRGHNDSGGASRFFYTAKASSSERNAGLEDGACRHHGAGLGERLTLDEAERERNVHPTVKPVSLMRYLCKLTRTPTGGVVLDPFMGSGTTGIACILEHRDFIGIEIDAQYAEIARKRIADMTGPLFVVPEVKHEGNYLYN